MRIEEKDNMRKKECARVKRQKVMGRLATMFHISL